MVAIVSGNALGLGLGTLGTLGSRGAQGTAGGGRNGELAYVNASSGNLVLQDHDDLMAGRGLSIDSLRTYNSQGLYDDDNGDNWSLGVYAGQLRLAGDYFGAVGSTVVRTERDGAKAVHVYDAKRGAYVSTDGGGAYDSAILTDAGWVWTDGDTGLVERYDAATGRLTSLTDPAGNSLTYTYATNGLLSAVVASNGDQTQYAYGSGGELTSLTTVFASDSAAPNQTRVVYGYDASNRLSSVSVDLSPDSPGITDGRAYVTTYTYDGDSKRVAGITQTDGTSLAFGYQLVGADYRVATVSDGLGNLTRFSYDTVARRTTVTDALGLKTLYEHDAAGQLLRVASMSASTTLQSAAYQYNATGDVIRVTDGDGNAVVYGYDVNGNQTLQRDAAGNTVTRLFDARHQLIAETAYATPDPDGAGALLPSTPQTTRYVYDTAGQNTLRFVLSAQGRVTEYAYDVFRQRTSEAVYAGAVYNLAGLADTSVPTLAQMTTWASTQDRTRLQRIDMAYDASGQLVRKTAYAKTGGTGAGVVDGTQSVTTFVRDRRGLLLSSTSPVAGQTSYVYDGLGRLLATTDAKGVLTVTTSFDDANQKSVETLTNGLRSVSTLDRAGRLTSRLQTSAALANLGETRFFYDAQGRLLMTQDPTGVRQWKLYDDAGRKVADIDGNGSLIEYGYDHSGRPTRTTAYSIAVDTSLLVDAVGKPRAIALAAVVPIPQPATDLTSWNAYDAAGRLVKTVDSSGAVQERQYDGASRLVKTVRYATRISTSSLGSAPTPAQIVVVADPAQDRVERWFYDQDGLLIGQLDAEGGLTETQYDAGGRPVMTLRHAVPAEAPIRAAGTLAQLQAVAQSAADIRTVTLYDGQGRVVGVVDGENGLTESVYDAGGRRVRQVRYATTLSSSVPVNATLAAIRPVAHAEDQVSTRVYDKLDRVTQATDAEGTVTAWTYDSVGNVVSTSRALGQPEVRTTNARYDVQGRLVGELSAEGSALLVPGQTQAQVDAIWKQHGLAHTYDAAGRRTSTVDLRNATTADPGGQRTLYFYDVDGHLTHTVDALGEVEERRFNTLGQLEATIDHAGTVSLANLAGGLGGGQNGSAIGVAVAALADNGRDGSTRYAYDNAGQLASRTRTLTALDSAVTTFVHDAFGDEIARTTALGAGAVRLDTTSHDRRGLQTASVSDVGGRAVRSSATYDAFGRQDSVTDGNGHVRRQQFDRLGRVVQAIDATGHGRSTGYDALDRVLTQTDALGHTTTFAYSTSARRTTVTTPEGISVVTVHTRHGQTQSVQDGNGTVTSHVYDRNGHLVSTSTPLDAARGVVTGQAFDRAGRLIETTDARGVKVVYTYDKADRVLTRELDPTGLKLKTTYAYDASGREVRVTDPNGSATTTSYDAAGRVLTRTIDDGGLNLRTTYRYDTEDRVLSVTGPGGTVTEYVYDALGRRETERVRIASGDIVTRYLYDGGDNVVARIDANGNVTRHAYDADDRLLFSVDAAGGVTRQQYDAAGRVSRTTRHAIAIDLAGLPTVATAEAIAARLQASTGHDAVEARRYDLDGRLRFTVDGTGAVVQFKRDRHGQVIERIAFANAIDLATWPSDVDPAPIADATCDQRVRTVYDALGRATFDADALGAVTERVYDGNGNVTRLVEHAVLLAAGSSPGTVGVSAEDRISVFAYDSANREIWRADAAGAVTRTEVDAAGQVVRLTRFANTVAAGGSPTAVIADAARDHVTRMVYDGAGRRTFSIDALNFVDRWRYDADGRITSTTRFSTPIAVGSDPAAVRIDATDRTQTYVVDPVGRVVAHTDAGGFTERFSYDAVGNTRTFTNAKGSVWSYDVDAAGRRIQETSPQVALTTVAGDDSTALSAGGTADAAVVTRWAYDALGNLLARTEAVGRTEERTTAYAYDARGRQVGVTTAPVAVYAGEADAALGLNGLSSAASRAEATRPLTTRTLYDAFGNAVANVDVSGEVSFKAYDLAGRVRYEVDALGQVTGYVRNAFGEATGVMRHAAGTTLAAAVPTAAAQAPGIATIAAIVEAPTADPSADRLLTTTFDRLGRAVQVLEPAAYNFDSATGTDSWTGKTTQNTYDAFGELIRTRLVGASPIDTCFYYDALGRRTATVDALGYVTERRYDAAGNLVMQTEFATKIASPWNVSGSPPAAADDRTTLYAYDALNRKVGETRRNVELAAGLDGSSARRDVSTSYGYDAVGNLTRTTDASGASVYSYYDALGRVTAVAAPTRPAADGSTALTPVTVFLRDAHGNVVVRLEPANGSPGAAEGTGVSSLASPGFALGAASPDDRRTVTRFDAAGHALQVTDAQGVNHYSAYDAHGRTAKQWQSVDDGGVRRTLFQVFRYDKLGRLTHTLDPAPYGANDAPTGGVTDAALEYNAFGEVVRSGIDGGRQAYFDFDNAGRLWRTNSGDGVDKVLLHDVFGRTTAEIRSTGAVDIGRDAQGNSLLTIKSVNDLKDTRRTETVYDALGRAVLQKLPSRADAVGGVKVREERTQAIVTGSETLVRVQQGTDQSIDSWTGENTVQLSWTSLAELGSGDIKVELDYSSLPVLLSGPAVDELGRAVPAVYSTPTSKSVSRILGAEEAAAGTTLQWAAQSGIAADGPMHLRVSKKDVTGTWQWVFDQSSFGPGGCTVTMAAPPDRSRPTWLEYAPLGSQVWQTAHSVSFGAVEWIDARGLPLGSYQYRVKTLGADGLVQTTSTGTLTLSTPDLTPIGIPIGYGPLGDGILAWTYPPAGTVQALNIRAAGSDTWSRLAVGGGSGGYCGVDTRALAGGTYEYELLWTAAGATMPYAHANGTFTIVAAVPPALVAPVNAPNLSGLAVGPTSVSWDAVSGVSATVVDSGQALVGGFAVGGGSLSWTTAPGIASVELRQLGLSEWASPPVRSAAGRDAIDIGALPDGDYEFRIVYASGGRVGAMGTGRLHVPSLPTTTLSASQVGGFQVSATSFSWTPMAGAARVDARIGAGAWQPIPVLAEAGRHSISLLGAAGNYEFRIVYDSADGVVAVGSGVLSVPGDGSMPQLSTAPPIDGFAASASALAWRAIDGSVTFERRAAGTTAWIAAAVVTDGTRQSTDISGLATGDYDVRVLCSRDGQPAALATGRLTVASPPTVDDTAASAVVGFGVDSTRVAWTPLAGVAKVEYFDAGANVWVPAPVTRVDGRDGVDIAALYGPAGAYDFRVSYEQQGRLVGLSAARLTIAAGTLAPIGGTPTFEWRPVGSSEWTGGVITTVGRRASASLAGLPAGDVELRIVYRDASGTTAMGTARVTRFATLPATTPAPTLSNTTLPRISGYGVTGTTLAWSSPAGTALFEVRTAGGAWMALPTQVAGSLQTVGIGGLAVGTYEFRISCESAQVTLALGAGNLTIHPLTAAGVPPATLSNTAVPEVAGFAVDAAALSWTTVPGGTVQAEGRLVGSGVWSAWSVVAAGTRSAIDLAGLVPGEYEFRLAYRSGLSLIAFGAGNVKVHDKPPLARPAPTLLSTTASNIAGLEATSTRFTWSAMSGTPTFEYRPAGGGTWGALTVATQANGKPGVDITGVSGTYDYRIRYAATDGTLSALNAGTIVTSTPTPVLSGTTSANVGGFTADRATLSWNKAAGGVNFYTRLGAGAWTELAVATGATRDSVDISLAAGTYDFLVVYSNGGVETAMASGTLIANAPVLSNTGGSAIGGLEVGASGFSWSAAAGTPTFQWRPVGTSGWTSLTVTTQPNGKPGVDISNTSGSFDYRIAYTSGGVLTSLGSGRITTSSPAPQLSATTAAYIVNLSASRNALSWNKPGGTLAAAQYRVVGTSSWLDITVDTTSSATLDTIDISHVYGNLEFRLVYKTGGVETAMATGNLAVYAPQLSHTTQSSVTGFTATSSKLSWSRLNAVDTPTFEYWNATAARWDPMTVVADGLSNHCVSLVGVVGTYDYRVTYTSAGQPTGFATGRLSAPGGSTTPTLSLTTGADVVGVDAGGTTVTWARKNNDVVTFEQRVSGTSAWTPVSVMRTSTTDSASIAALGAGNYDYRIVYRTAGGQMTALASGNLAVGLPPTLSATTASNVGGFAATTTTLSWTASSLGTVGFQYWDATAGKWVAGAVTTSLGRSSVNIAGVVGTYTYRVTYTDAKGLLVALGTGTLKATAWSVPTLSATTQGNVVGISAAGGTLAWTKPNADVAKLERRLAGSGAVWTAMTVTSGTTQDSVDLSALPAGQYEFRITTTGGTVVTALGTGTVAIAAAPVLGSTTASYLGGFSADAMTLSWTAAPGTVKFERWDSLAGRWVASAVTTAAGRASVDIRGLVGSIQFRVTCTSASGMLTSLGDGTFTAQAGATPTFISTTLGQLSGIVATPTALSWAPATAGTPTVLRRAVGTTTWSPVAVGIIDGRPNVDLAAIPVGDHEFRVAYADASGPTALGMIAVRILPEEQPATPAPSLTSTAVPTVGGFNATASTLSWAAAAGTPSFETRVVGQTAWRALAVTTVNGRAVVDISGCAPQSYEFRVLYTSGSSIVARGAGDFTTSAPGADGTPAPTVFNATVQNLGDYQISSAALGWTAAAGAVVFERRPIDSPSWTTSTVTRTGSGSSSRDSVSLSGLAAGSYEFRAIYTAAGATTALGSGTFAIQPASPATVPPPITTVTTPVYVPGSMTAGTPATYASTSTTGSQPKAVSLTGSGLGYTLVQVASLNGYATDALRPVISQTFDRWGNVVSTSDPRNAAWKTTYRWNFDNRLVMQTTPTTGIAGSEAVIGITYDALGRQVAVRDALGNVNASLVDAAGQVVEERHADGGIVRHRYDAFGDKTASIDAVGNEAAEGSAARDAHTTRFTHDRLGRLVEIVRSSVDVYGSSQSSQTGQLQLVAPIRRTVVERFTYDQAARKVRHEDGDGRITRYAYDAAGRVISTIEPLGTTSRIGYDALGHKVAETDPNGRSSSWTTDYFGHVTQHVNLGGQIVRYGYDHAGQVIGQTSSGGTSPAQQNLTYTYDTAGQLIVVNDLALGKTTTYAYDLSGRRVLERTVQAGVVYQDNHLAYDALGRLRDVSDGRAHVAFEYDRNGNRTSVITHVDVLAAAGATTDQPHDTARFFQYDAMNRQTVVDAFDASGTIGQGQGHRIVYDRNGNRSTDTFWGNRVVTSGGETAIAYYSESGEASYGTVPITFKRQQGLLTESYRYDSQDRLVSVEHDGVQVDHRDYDAAGHVLQTGPASLPQGYAAQLNQDIPADQAIGLERRLNLFDANGRLLYQQTFASDGTSKQSVDYRNGYDAAGNVRSYTVREANGSTKGYSTEVAGYEGYVQKSTTATVNGATSTAQSQYDGNGFLVGITDSGNARNNRTFINDAQGRALLVNQGGNLERQLIVNGELLGRYGIGIDELQPRTTNGDPNYAPVADFTFGYQPINGNYPAASPGVYAVRQGDTLQSIARGAYGDSRLWYRIAEANGLGGDQDLRVGQTLTVPSQAGALHNDADTFRPYDPSKINGDTAPALPSPSSGGGCGGMGQVLMVVVAIVVTIYTAGLAATALAPAASAGTATTFSAGMSALGGAYGTGVAVAAGALGGAAGSIASQGVGIAIGAQSDFNWKQVALSAVGGGVSGGLGAAASGTGPLAGAGFGTTVTRTALGNALSQGIGVVAGLQDSFQWKAVAAAAVGSGVGYGVDEAFDLGARGEAAEGVAPEVRFGKALLSGVASGASAALARGGRVTVRQVAVDAFGNAVGQSVKDQIFGGSIGDGRTVYNDGDIALSELRMGAPYQSNLHDLIQLWGGSGGFAGEFGYVPPVDRSNDILVASAGRGLGVDPVSMESLKGPDGVYRVEIRGTNTTPDTDGDGPGEDLPAQRVEVVGPRMTDAEKAAYDAQQFHEVNEARVAAGAYDRFREISDAFSAGRYGEMWRHITFEASNQAGAGSSGRISPPPSADLQRLNRMLASPIGTAASLVVRGFGGSLRAQDIALDAGAFGENVIGGVFGLPRPAGGAQAWHASPARGPRSSLDYETEALGRIAANNRAGASWAGLSKALQQARGQVDFAHIEAEVTFKANGQVKAQGGHFSSSPQLQRIRGTETVSPNGVIFGQVNLLGPDGNFHLKSNNGGFSSMTPDSWSLARAKGEVSQAFINRTLGVNGQWIGSSGGVKFVFYPPSNKVPQWRGYPVQP